MGHQPYDIEMRAHAYLIFNKMRSTSNSITYLSEIIVKISYELKIKKTNVFSRHKKMFSGEER